MKISNRLFISIIASSIAICLLVAIIVRISISKFEYEDILSLSDQMIYYPYIDIKYSNGVFEDVSKVEDSSTLYKYILRGKATGQREVLVGAILTEIEVTDVLRGDIDDKIINIYEPISIDNSDANTITTFEGYNFIKNNREYIFALYDLNTDYHNIYTKGKSAIFMYTTPFYGKFPLEYETKDFAVFSESGFDKSAFKYYSGFSNYEQIFRSEEQKSKYFNEYKKLLKFIN
jgi:hypothetical protein